MLLTRLPSKPATMVFVQVPLPVNVAVAPAVYSSTDSGITSPARPALTESRNSGLIGSLDLLEKMRAVPVAMKFGCTARNPALPVAWRTKAPGRYSPTPPEERLKLADSVFDPRRKVTAWSWVSAARETNELDAAPSALRSMALGPPLDPSCRVTMLITPLMASLP